MTGKPPRPADPDRYAPYGAQQRRSWTPLIVLGAVYVCWVLVLLWMAAFHVGR